MAYIDDGRRTTDDERRTTMKTSDERRTTDDGRRTTLTTLTANDVVAYNDASDGYEPSDFDRDSNDQRPTTNDQRQ